VSHLAHCDSAVEFDRRSSYELRVITVEPADGEVVRLFRLRDRRTIAPLNRILR
jgi:hypothetical protein